MLRLNASAPETLTGNGLTASVNSQNARRRVYHPKHFKVARPTETPTALPPSHSYRSGPPSLALIAAKPRALASALSRLYWPCAGSWWQPVTIRGDRYTLIVGMYWRCGCAQSARGRSLQSLVMESASGAERSRLQPLAAISLAPRWLNRHCRHAIRTRQSENDRNG
jgi:hypothetical protein